VRPVGFLLCVCVCEQIVLPVAWLKLCGMVWSPVRCCGSTQSQPHAGHEQESKLLTVSSARQGKHSNGIPSHRAVRLVQFTSITHFKHKHNLLHKHKHQHKHKAVPSCPTSNMH
jgi:hypothetical protein